MEVLRREPFGGPRVGDRGVNTQRSILEAALVVFHQRGFHGTKVDLITETAGCSRPSFYQYFSSKEDVFWHLARELSRKMAEIAATVGTNTPDEAGLHDVARWVDMLIDVQSKYASIIDSFPAAVRQPTEQYRASSQTTEQLGNAIIASAPLGQHLGDFGALHTVVGAVALRTIHFWNLGLVPLPRPIFVHGLAQTMHRLLHQQIDGVNIPPPEGSLGRIRGMPTLPRGVELPTPARARGRETRDLLLSSATLTLGRFGYHASRVDDIVTEAKVSHGSFYRYFSSKDDLFGVLAERATTAMFDLAAQLSPAEGPDAVEAWLVAFFDLYRDNGGIISAWQELGYDESPMNSFAMGIASAVLDRLRQSFEEQGPGLAAVDSLVLLAIVERMPYLVYTLEAIRLDDALESTMVFLRRTMLG